MCFLCATKTLGSQAEGGSQSSPNAPLAGDGLQRSLVPRSRFQLHLKRSVRCQKAQGKQAMPLENEEGRAMGECNVHLRPCAALKEAIPCPSKQTQRSLCMIGRHGKRDIWPSSMMTFATDDVFHDAAGGVGRGRARPSDRTAWPALHVLLAPVCAGEDMVTVRGTTHGAHRGDSEMVWHRLGGVRKASQQLPRRGSW